MFGFLQSRSFLQSRRSAEVKASRSAPMLTISTLGQARWTPRRYDRLAEEGYRKNVIAFRCIREIAQNAAAIPWVLYEGERELALHPLLDLLRRPNPQMGQSAFFESLYAYGQIAGNVYLEAVRVDGESAPRELWPLRPDRMRVIPDKTGLPSAYEYSVGGKSTRWEVDPVSGQGDILHLKSFNPLDDWYGQGALETAILSIDQHNAASAWNQSLLQNAARPSGALVYAPKEGPALLGEDQFRRLRQELEEQIEGASNAGRPLLLEGGLEWQAMSLSPAEMDWQKSRDSIARDIALAFGVPPQVIGLSDSQTYANYKEARLAFYEDTVLPAVYALRDALNNWLVPMFAGGKLRLDIDLDAVPALSPRREALWEKISKADFLTPNEKRAALGYGVSEE